MNVSAGSGGPIPKTIEAPAVNGEREIRSTDGVTTTIAKDDSLSGKLQIRGNGSVMGIGPGGNYALAAGRALLSTDLDAEAIARRALEIAAGICVYTNTNFVLESIASK